MSRLPSYRRRWILQLRFPIPTLSPPFVMDLPHLGCWDSEEEADAVATMRNRDLASDFYTTALAEHRSFRSFTYDAERWYGKSIRIGIAGCVWSVVSVTFALMFNVAAWLVVVQGLVGLWQLWMLEVTLRGRSRYRDWELQRILDPDGASGP